MYNEPIYMDKIEKKKLKLINQRKTTRDIHIRLTRTHIR